MMHGHQGVKEKRWKKEAMIQQKIYIWGTRNDHGREAKRKDGRGISERRNNEEKHTRSNQDSFKQFCFCPCSSFSPSFANTGWWNTVAEDWTKWKWLEEKREERSCFSRSNFSSGSNEILPVVWRWLLACSKYFCTSTHKVWHADEHTRTHTHTLPRSCCVTEVNAAVTYESTHLAASPDLTLLRTPHPPPLETKSSFRTFRFLAQ